MSIASRISDAKLLDYFIIKDGETTLSIFEGLSIRRIFTIEVNEAEERGKHAHKTCSQWLSVVEGTIDVLLKDTYSTRSIKLKNDGSFLFIPSGIWSSQLYSSMAIALVLCDQIFIENDYIRNWEQFVQYKHGLE